MTTARQAGFRFVLIGFAVVVLVALAGLAVADRAAEREAVQDAQTRTITLGRAVIEPALSEQLIAGNPLALQNFDTMVRRFVLSDDVIRVKLWTAEGRIAYSDEKALINSVYPLGKEEAEALEGGSVDAEDSDLSKNENQYERGRGALIEVYLRVTVPNSGRSLLFETYHTRRVVLARSRDTLLAFGPITLGGFALLLAALVPLAWSLARSLEASQAERERLLQHALEASSLERRRIAAHLHDGVVQSLAGSAFALSGVADTLGSGFAANAVHGVAAELRQSVRALRSLLVEIYPPSLRDAGLVEALSDLTAQLRSREIDVTLDLTDNLELPQEKQAALFRVAQEALRNVVRHADAQTVQMTLAQRDGEAVLSVADDGRGFEESALEVRTTSSGHFGLTLLTDSIREIGGDLTVDGRPGRGTTVTATVPLR